jgi:hypothetical protein
MNSEQFLDNNLLIANDILYQNEKDLKNYIDKLSNNITLWAREHSEVYRNLYEPNRIFTKDDFEDKDSWYVNFLVEKSNVSSTSGSTTGDPFSYAIYKKYVPFLMNDQHWNLILKEYNLYDTHIKICVLYFFKDTSVVFKDDTFVIADHSISEHSRYNHGSKNCSVDFINFTNYNTSDWFDKLFDYLESTEIDIIISTGPIVHELCNQIRKRKYNKKICYLLSHSNEFPIKRDLRFLKDDKLIDYYCDHMRCWDGGACFFTCKFGYYHLLDNITHHKCIDNKLITTDYYSLAAPFVNYWNGDICEIEDSYQRCKCRRLFRPFRMLENRPFAIKGTKKLTEIKEEIKKLDFRKDLIQFQFENSNIRISTRRDLNEEEKNKLKNLLYEYDIIYN